MKENKNFKRLMVFVIVVEFCFLGIEINTSVRVDENQPQWPTVWELYDVDPGEDGVHDDYRDVHYAYYYVDNYYLYFRLECYGYPDFTAEPESRYKFFIDVDDPNNMGQSGGSVYEAEYLLFVEDSPKPGGDGQGDVYLLEDLNNNGFISDDWPSYLNNPGPILNNSVAGYRIVGKCIDIYISQANISNPTYAYFTWATDNENPNLDQAPYSDRSDNYWDVDLLKADLSIVKYDSRDPVDPGASLTYTLNVTNHGPHDAENVNVTDTLPAEVTFDSAVPTSNGNSGSTYWWTYSSLDVGESEIITINATVDSDVTGDITNIAYVYNDTYDPVLYNNEYSEKTNISPMVTLSVYINGNGSVVKDPDQSFYVYGTVVELNATADFGWTFSHWSGDLSGSNNPTSITMDSDKDVTAHFNMEEYTLTINYDGTGSGSVTLDPSGGSYPAGTTIELTAVPNFDSEFIEWTGDLIGTDNPDTIVMDSDKAVTATFMQAWLAEININGSIDPPLRTGLDMIDYVMFGEKATAWDGVDGHDLPYPGTPPAPYVAGWFMTDFDYPYDELERDIRHYPAVPPNGKIWDLWVETDAAGNGETALITMTWDNTILQGNEYDYVILRDYLSGDTLEDMRATGTFVFTADHGMGYHFEIVCGFNHCPVGVDDEYETNQNTPLIVAAPGVLDNDYDLDGDSISVRSGSLVYSGPGSVGLSTDGSFEYMPLPGWFGTDSFSYEVSDGVCFDEATVTITVLELKGIDVNVGWNLISMPAYEENFDKTNIIVEYAGDYYTWAEAIANAYILPYTYGWSAGAYSNYDYLMRGDGYWLWAYVDCTLSIPSNVEPENHIATFDEDEGWYLVGAPYISDLAKWQVRIHHDGIYHTWDEAVADGHILAYLYDWNRNTQNYETVDTFMSGYGYWMYVYEPCSLKKA